MKNDNGRLLIKQSTRDFYLDGKETADYSLFDFLHGYLYSRWPYLYIGVATGEHGLTRVLKPIFLFLSNVLTLSEKNYTGGNGDPYADSYHGKVIPVHEAKNLVSVQEDIVIKDLETVIPYTQAKDIILKNPDKIAALVCPCRSSRTQPCYPLDVCIVVGDPFVSFILEHRPDKARLVSSEEAMEILQAEHERGHVHHAFFKDAMLNRFYAICNCCACCCGAFQAHQHGSPMLASSGFSAAISNNLCEGCGTCQDYCQFLAIEVINKIASVNQEACFGCGVCVDVCENSAISLNLDPKRGIPLEIKKLIDEAQLAS
jgi:Pyruvate/2-oxoacid:ferredoxin oxidoreductase delta subunit